MATNITVYDLELYPDNGKTVTVDLKKVYPVGAEGDEQWVVSCTTTAYSNNTSRTAIQDIYLTDLKQGWYKSSGLLTSTRFTVSSTNNQFQLKMDGDGTWRTLTLSSGVNMSGDVVAEDMETQINLISGTLYDLAYKNATVEYKDGKFKIVSGTVSSAFTGAERSSVAVRTTGYSNNAVALLGFDIGCDSQTLAGSELREVAVATTYSTPAATLIVNSGLGTVSGSAFCITDGTNTEFFVCVGGTETNMSVYSAAGAKLANNYTAAVSKVQKLIYVDPEYQPNNFSTTVDGYTRWAIKSVANQIDFSS